MNVSPWTLKFIAPDAQPVLNTSQYGAVEVLGQLMKIDVSWKEAGGFVGGLLVVDDDNEKAAIDFYFFNAQPATYVNNAAMALTLADQKKLCMYHKISVAAADYTTNTGNAFASIYCDGSTHPLVQYDNASSIWCYAVPTGTPTYTAATDLYFLFGIYRS